MIGGICQNYGCESDPHHRHAIEAKNKPMRPANFKDALPRADLAFIINSAHTGLSKSRADCEVELVLDEDMTGRNRFDAEIKAAKKAAETLIKRNKCVGSFEVLCYREDRARGDAIRVVMRWRKPA